MDFCYSDGGRRFYFKKQNVNDCVVRAICNATDKDYKEVYDTINQIAKAERRGKIKRWRSSSRNGVFPYTYKKYLNDVLKLKWVNCAQSNIHLSVEELPKAKLIVDLEKHFTCVKYGKIFDTFNCSLGQNKEKPNLRVYGYWIVE